MADNNPPKSVCPIGIDTLQAAIKAGYVAQALGMIALLDNGYKPGEVISRKQFVACGIGPDLAKTIMNQCEGKDYDKRKIAKNKSSKTRKADKGLSPSKKVELDKVIQSLETSNKLRNQSLYTDNRSQNLHLMDSTTYHPDSSINRPKPPESSAVKALFSNYRYNNHSQPLDISSFKAKHGRGRPSRLFVIPTLDEYAVLFGVNRKDVKQSHYAISSHRTVKSFCDAVHLAWMEANQKNETNKHSLVELCNVQGDSAKTVRERNRRTGIKTEHNFFSHPVTQLELQGLLLKCRGGCWLELDLPGTTLPSNLIFGREIRVTPHYPVNKYGLEKAREEWKVAGTPGMFESCLRIGGFATNSYLLPN